MVELRWLRDRASGKCSENDKLQYRQLETQIGTYGTTKMGKWRNVPVVLEEIDDDK